MENAVSRTGDDEGIQWGITPTNSLKNRLNRSLTIKPDVKARPVPTHVSIYKGSNSKLAVQLISYNVESKSNLRGANSDSPSL